MENSSVLVLALVSPVKAFFCNHKQWKGGGWALIAKDVTQKFTGMLWVFLICAAAGEGGGQHRDSLEVCLHRVCSRFW